MHLVGGLKAKEISLADLGVPRLANPRSAFDPLRPAELPAVEVPCLAQVIENLRFDISRSAADFTMEDAELDVGLSSPFYERGRGAADERAVLLAYVIHEHHYVLPSFTPPGTTGAGFERFLLGNAALAVTLGCDGNWIMNAAMDEDGLAEAVDHAISYVRLGHYRPHPHHTSPYSLLRPSPLPAGSSVLTRIQKALRMVVGARCSSVAGGGTEISAESMDDIPLTLLELRGHDRRTYDLRLGAIMPGIAGPRVEKFRAQVRLSHDGIVETILTDDVGEHF
jgi:hypothetical protein